MPGNPSAVRSRGVHNLPAMLVHVGEVVPKDRERERKETKGGGIGPGCPRSQSGVVLQGPATLHGDRGGLHRPTCLTSSPVNINVLMATSPDETVT